MRHNPGRGLMPEFVEACTVIVYLFIKTGLRGHLNEVCRGHVEGAVTTYTEVRPGCLDQRLGGGNGLAFGKRRGIGRQPVAQALALGDVE